MIIDSEAASFDEAMRVSRLLFGNQDRLIVMAAVGEAEPGAIYARNIAEQLGITDNRVSPQLSKLEEAGLLARMPRVGGERRVYYERRDSSLWNLCIALMGEVDARVGNAASG